MKLRIDGNAYDETPIWWRHFVEFIEGKHPHYNKCSDNLQDRILTLELKKFKGTLYFLESSDKTTDVDYIEFDEEKHMTYFIMKWS